MALKRRPELKERDRRQEAADPVSHRTVENRAHDDDRHDGNPKENDMEAPRSFDHSLEYPRSPRFAKHSRFAKNPTLTSAGRPTDTLFVMTERSANPESLFPTLREIVRDTARRLGKDVRLHLSGEIRGRHENEISRIQDALVQALRNAIDHGIESAAVRAKAGKSAAGQIWVEFTEENAETVVTIRDDGAGVDLVAVSRKAVGLGIVDAPEALPAKESLALLFQPGFSTKKTVTEVSGRGIGLDIVQSVVESFAGKVEIDTTRGKGTTLVLRFGRKSTAAAA